jgi:hypothetical protein
MRQDLSLTAKYSNSLCTMSIDRCPSPPRSTQKIYGSLHITSPPCYWDISLQQRTSYGKSQYPWSGAGKPRITYEGSCPEAERAYADHMTLYFHEGCEDDYIQDIAAAPAPV